jgi:hypothetical protein
MLAGLIDKLSTQQARRCCRPARERWRAEDEALGGCRAATVSRSWPRWIRALAAASTVGRTSWTPGWADPPTRERATGRSCRGQLRWRTHTRDLLSLDREKRFKHQDLGVLGYLGSGEQRQPAQHPGEQQIDESEGHSERACRAGCGPWSWGQLVRKVLIRRRDRVLGTHRRTISDKSSLT